MIWDSATPTCRCACGASDRGAGASGNAVTAETSARKFLAEHLALLAPGAKVSDFTVLANDVSGSLRTVSFAQRAYGLRVLGGAVSLTSSHDNLVAMSSTAIPNVEAHIRLPGGALSPARLASSATGWLAQDDHIVDVKEYGERVIVPIVHARGRAHAPSIPYSVAETLTVEASGKGDWPLGRLARCGERGPDCAPLDPDVRVGQGHVRHAGLLPGRHAHREGRARGDAPARRRCRGCDASHVDDGRLDHAGR